MGYSYFHQLVKYSFKHFIILKFVYLFVSNSDWILKSLLYRKKSDQRKQRFQWVFFPLFLLTQLLYFVQRWTDDLFVEQLLSCIYQINLNIWIAINLRKYSYEQPLIEDEFKGFPLQFKKNNRVKTNQFYIKVQNWNIYQQKYPDNVYDTDAWLYIIFVCSKMKT